MLVSVLASLKCPISPAWMVMTNTAQRNNHRMSFNCIGAKASTSRSTKCKREYPPNVALALPQPAQAQQPGRESFIVLIALLGA